MNFTVGPLGCDVSFYQDDNTTPQKVDFAKMKAAGAKFCLIRAGQNTWVDQDYADHARSARAAGIAWGSYWFFDSRSSPASQAALWKQIMGNDVPPVLVIDLEESYGGAYRGERNWKAFIAAAEGLFPGKTIVIYTANWWWQQQLKAMGKEPDTRATLEAVSDPAYFARYPLWVAGYATSPSSVTLPAPWRNKEAHMWQFTSSGDGRKYGAESSRIDLNYWNAKMDFDSFWSVSPTPPPTQTRITVSIKIDPPGVIPVEVVYE